MPPIIYGLCGKKGSGKSTLARQIPGAEVIPFAKPLKDALIAMGLDKRLFTDPKCKEVPQKILQNQTPRYVMQTLGTEWGRHLIGPYFWEDLWVTAVERSKSSIVIVDDVRFASEANLVYDLGGQIIQIKRGEDPPLRKWYQFWKPKEHESEQLRFEGPTILNNGTPEELLEKFRAITVRGT